LDSKKLPPHRGVGLKRELVELQGEVPHRAMDGEVEQVISHFLRL
jgi:hypothetical protein